MDRKCHDADEDRQAGLPLNQRFARYRIADAVARVVRLGDDRVEGRTEQRGVQSVGYMVEPVRQDRGGDRVDLSCGFPSLQLLPGPPPGSARCPLPHCPYRTIWPELLPAPPGRVPPVGGTCAIRSLRSRTSGSRGVRYPCCGPGTPASREAPDDQLASRDTWPVRARNIILFLQYA